MRYFTKEWYQLCGKTSLYCMLEEAKEAELLSEQYFNKLYSKKAKEWIKNNKKSLKELKKFETNTESVKPFETFHDFYLSKIDYVQKMLPETILSQIADIRVFALDKASHDVIRLTKEYCDKCRALMEKVCEDYRHYLEEMSATLDEEVVSNLCFHDCVIIDIDQNDKSLTLHFDNSGELTDIDRLVFNDFQIQKIDRPIVNTWWLYEEIYRREGVYEIHALLQNEDLDLIDFIVSAESVQFS